MTWLRPCVTSGLAQALFYQWSGSGLVLPMAWLRPCVTNRLAQALCYQWSGSGIVLPMAWLRPCVTSGLAQALCYRVICYLQMHFTVLQFGLRRKLCSLNMLFWGC